MPLFLSPNRRAVDGSKGPALSGIADDSCLVKMMAMTATTMATATATKAATATAAMTALTSATIMLGGDCYGAGGGDNNGDNNADDND